MVVEAMRAHPQEEDVQEMGCGALGNVCCGDGAAGLARKRRASQAGGRTAAVAAMQAHPENTEVQEVGQEVLDNLPEFGSLNSFMN